MLLAIGKDNAINVNTRLFKYAANLIEIKGIQGFKPAAMVIG